VCIGQGPCPQGAAGQHDQGGLATAQDSRCVLHRIRRYLGNRQRRQRPGNLAARIPADIRRQDQAGYASWGRAGGPHGRRGIRADGRRMRGGASPDRYGTRPAFGIGSQRRIERAVIRGLVADDVDDRRLRAACVVQVGQAIGQARTAMEQRGCRLVGHARVAVGRTGDHTFEQAQHAAHAGNPVQCGHKMHLAGARVGEACIDAAGQQRLDQAFRAVH